MTASAIVIDTIFVYGTLMRGEVREPCWPHAPLAVWPARARGALYDLGTYPALIDGSDWVRGECWVLREEHVASTLKRLDEIEGFGGQGNDLYLRETIMCWRLDQPAESDPLPAFTYRFADAAGLKQGDYRRARRITASQAGYCQWTRPVDPYQPAYRPSDER